MRPCAKDLCTLLQHAERYSLEAIKKKFSLSKYMEVAKIKLTSNQREGIHSESTYDTKHTENSS